jgi:multidrug resistance efflux pump
MQPVEAVNAMKQRLDEARETFEPWKFKSELDPTRRDLKKLLDLAQSDYNAAVRWLENEVALSQAEAQLELALRDYEDVKDGADANKLETAQAQVLVAKAELESSQADLDELEIKAPFDGTVGRLDAHPGDWVLPGEVVLVFADLTHLRVKTTDLSERDVSSVHLDQPVLILIEATGQSVPGKVSEITPLAETLGGDVVYQTIIELDELPQCVLPGMSVVVTFE